MLLRVLLFLVFVVNGVIYADFSRDDSRDTVEDIEANLIWQDDQLSPKIKWRRAEQYCADLKLDGKDDWRVPTLAELERLVGDRYESPAIKESFKSVAPDGYWSSETFEGYAGFAMIVHFHSGNSYKYAKSTPIYVRCVREKK